MIYENKHVTSNFQKTAYLQKNGKEKNETTHDTSESEII